MSHAYKPTDYRDIRGNEKFLTAESLYWSNYKIPITIKQSASNIQYLNLNAISLKLAITYATKIQLYDLAHDKLLNTFSNFKSAAFGGSFRSDGELLVSGADENLIKLFSLTTKSQLREFIGHVGEVHVTKFSHNKYRIVSASDDKSIKYWDIATGSALGSYHKHTDYIRCGQAFNTFDAFLSGSYDQTAQVVDFRSQDNNVSISVKHGAPIEDVLLFPNDKIFFTAGGNCVKVWDMAHTSKCLHTFAGLHAKTITCLSLAGMSTSSPKLITGSLDKQLRIHDLSNYETVHTISYPSPILSLAISPNDEHICVGMTEGLLSISQKRSEEPSQTKRRKMELSTQKLLHNTNPTPIFNGGLTRYFEHQDSVVPSTLITKDTALLSQTRPSLSNDRSNFEIGIISGTEVNDETNVFLLEDNMTINLDPKRKKGLPGPSVEDFDRFLRKYDFNAAFDKVFSKYERNIKHPQITVSFFRELIRHNKLRTVLTGRWCNLYTQIPMADDHSMEDENEIHDDSKKENKNTFKTERQRIMENFQTFLLKFVNDPRYATILIDVANVVVDCLASDLQMDKPNLGKAIDPEMIPTPQNINQIFDMDESTNTQDKRIAFLNDLQASQNDEIDCQLYATQVLGRLTSLLGRNERCAKDMASMYSSLNMESSISSVRVDAHETLEMIDKFFTT